MVDVAWRELVPGRAVMVMQSAGSGEQLAVVVDAQWSIPDWMGHTKLRVVARRWVARRKQWTEDLPLDVDHITSMKPRADLMRAAGLAP